MTLASLASPRCAGLEGGGPSRGLLSTFIPVFQNPIEIPSYCLGSIKAPSLQEDVDKELAKALWKWSRIWGRVATVGCSWFRRQQRVGD